MILISSSCKELYRYLNKSMIKIDKNIWIGNLTIREQDTLKSMFYLDISNKTMLFNVSKNDYEKFLNKTLDFVYDK